MLHQPHQLHQVCQEIHQTSAKYTLPTYNVSQKSLVMYNGKHYNIIEIKYHIAIHASIVYIVYLISCFNLFGVAASNT